MAKEFSWANYSKISEFVKRTWKQRGIWFLELTLHGKRIVTKATNFNTAENIK
jgi:hypothetical protein